MDKRWRNIVVFAIIVIAIGAAIVLFVLPQSQQLSFSEGKSKVQSIWRSEGIDAGEVTYANLGDVESQALNTVKSKLASYKSELDKMQQNNSVQEIKSYAQINLAYLESLEIARQLADVRSEFDYENALDVCGQLGFYESLNSKTAELATKLSEKNELVDSFKRSYKTEETEVALFYSNLSDINKIVQKSNSGLATIRQSCGAVG